MAQGLGLRDVAMVQFLGFSVSVYGYDSRFKVFKV